jgi:hypothetical protein
LASINGSAFQVPVLKLIALPYEQFPVLRDNIAIHGVLVPTLVDDGGPRRKIIDGSYRKASAAELGYDCSEIVTSGLSEEQERTLKPRFTTFTTRACPGVVYSLSQRNRWLLIQRQQIGLYLNPQ